MDLVSFYKKPVPFIFSHSHYRGNQFKFTYVSVTIKIVHQVNPIFSKISIYLYGAQHVYTKFQHKSLILVHPIPPESMVYIHINTLTWKTLVTLCIIPIVSWMYQSKGFHLHTRHQDTMSKWSSQLRYILKTPHQSYINYKFSHSRAETHKGFSSFWNNLNCYQNSEIDNQYTPFQNIQNPPTIKSLSFLK